LEAEASTSFQAFERFLGNADKRSIMGLRTHIVRETEMKTLKLFTIMLMVLGSLNVFAVVESGTDCDDVVNGSPVDTTDTSTINDATGSGGNDATGN